MRDMWKSNFVSIRMTVYLSPRFLHLISTYFLTTGWRRQVSLSVSIIVCRALNWGQLLSLSSWKTKGDVIIIIKPARDAQPCKVSVCRVLWVWSGTRWTRKTMCMFFMLLGHWWSGNMWLAEKLSRRDLYVYLAWKKFCYKLTCMHGRYSSGIETPRIDMISDNGR